MTISPDTNALSWQGQLVKENERLKLEVERLTHSNSELTEEAAGYRTALTRISTVTVADRSIAGAMKNTANRALGS